MNPNWHSYIISRSGDSNLYPTHWWVPVREETDWSGLMLCSVSPHSASSINSTEIEVSEDTVVPVPRTQCSMCPSLRLVCNGDMGHILHILLGRIHNTCRKAFKLGLTENKPAHLFDQQNWVWGLGFVAQHSWSADEICLPSRCLPLWTDCLQTVVFC